MIRRYNFIDGIKFFAMLLCVLGHMIQNGSYHPVPEDWNEDGMFLFIYSFHMPLFIFVSGIFLNSSIKLTLPVLIKKKAIQLLLPAYIWNFLILIVCYIITLTTSLVVNYPTSILSPYWFLTLLFLSYIAGYCIVKYSKKRKIIIFNTVIISILVIFLPKENYSHINSFFPFFMAGYFMRNIILRDNSKRLELTIIMGALVSYLCFWHFWKFDYTVYMSPLDASCILNPEMIFIAFYRFMIGMSAIIFFIFVFKCFDSISNYKIIKKLGSMTLGVYLLQSPIILLIGECCPIVISNHVFRDFVVLPAVSMVIYFFLVFIQMLICKNQHLAFVLFGKYSQNGNKKDLFSKYK